MTTLQDHYTEIARQGQEASLADASAMVGLAAVLAPLWIPVLIVVGVIALIKRCTRNSRVAAT